MLQQVAQAIGLEQPFLERRQDDPIERLLPDRLARASFGRPVHLGAAGIIAVAATLAGTDRQSFAAETATRDRGQQDRTGGDARRRDLRRPRCPERGCRLELRAIDDRGTYHLNPRLFGLRLAVIA
nr:hypothetical protein [Sphingomonas sp. CL5.1]